MSFNPSKCQVLHITRAKCPFQSRYVLNGSVLESVPSAKYLGVSISDNLSWTSHINSVSKNNRYYKLEAVQRRSALWATRDYRRTSSVTQMIKDLNWRTLEQRRIDSRLTLMYKITYDLVVIPAANYLVPNTRQSRHNHQLAYRQIPTLKDYYKFTFFPRTIIHWKALRFYIPVLPTVAQFIHAVCQVVQVSP